MKLKIGAFEINLPNKLFYTLIIIAILGIVAIGVYASGSEPPPKPTDNLLYISPNPGHPVSEIDFSEGINGDVIVNRKIGIGTKEPKDELHIKDNSAAIIRLEGNNGNVIVRLAADGNKGLYIADELYNPTMFVGVGGKYDKKVGIGTNSPSVELDVNGNIKADKLCLGDDCINSWDFDFGDKIHFGNIPKIIMWSHTVIALQGEKLSCSHLCSSEPGVKLNTGQCIAAWDGSKNIIDCNEENSKISCSCQGIAT